VRICIDDFGTGYSSLSYLLRFPAQTLKIDRSFVTDLSTGVQHAEMVRTIILLARNLGMDVIAEGVETEDQLSRLRAMECDFVQGYLVSKPVDAVRARRVAARREAPRTSRGRLALTPRRRLIGGQPAWPVRNRVEQRGQRSRPGLDVGGALRGVFGQRRFEERVHTRGQAARKNETGGGAA
jgi:hypothetical protein